MIQDNSYITVNATCTHTYFSSYFLLEEPMVYKTKVAIQSVSPLYFRSFSWRVSRILSPDFGGDKHSASYSSRCYSATPKCRLRPPASSSNSFPSRSFELLLLRFLLLIEPSGLSCMNIWVDVDRIASQRMQALCSKRIRTSQNVSDLRISSSVILACHPHAGNN
jgi:hypothetical protein